MVLSCVVWTPGSTYVARCDGNVVSVGRAVSGYYRPQREPEHLVAECTHILHGEFHVHGIVLEW